MCLSANGGMVPVLLVTTFLIYKESTVVRSAVRYLPGLVSAATAFAVCVAVNMTFAAPCSHTSDSCFEFGPANGGKDPGPYPGYCCTTQGPAARGCNAGEDKNVIADASLQCGDLKDQWIIYILGQPNYVCDILISVKSCGGSQANTCDGPIPCVGT